MPIHIKKLSFFLECWP